MAKKLHFRNNNSVRSSKGVNSNKEKILEEQSDFYDEGVALEELAERWILSDIKKTLAFYQRAMDVYNSGLQCVVNRTDKTTYNIAYNKLTLLLKIHSEYVHGGGAGNIIQYVNGLEPDLVSTLFPDLSTILTQFIELITLSEQNETITWDLYFNYLTCLLIFAESKEVESDFFFVNGSETVQLSDTVIQCIKNLILLHTDFLENLQPSIDMEHEKINQEQQDPELQKDMIANSTYDINTGTGIKTMTQHNTNAITPSEKNPDQDQDQYVESSSSMSIETYFDTLTLGNKFCNIILEALISYELENKDISQEQEFQKNYIVNNINKLHQQIIGLQQSQTLFTSDENIARDLQLSMRLTDYLTHYKDYNYIWNKLNEVDLASCSFSDYIQNEVDFLKFVSDLDPVGSTSLYTWEQKWGMCTIIDKFLNRAIQLLSKERSNISIGLVKNRENELSPLTTTLSGLYYFRCENEMLRLQLQSHKLKLLLDQDVDREATIKVINILKKNIKMLSTNAINTAKQPCGMREYINDKLQRNNAYKEAVALEATISSIPL